MPLSFLLFALLAGSLLPQLEVGGMLHCHDLFQTQRPEQRQFELNFRPECRIDCQNHKGKRGRACQSSRFNHQNHHAVNQNTDIRRGNGRFLRPSDAARLVCVRRTHRHGAVLRYLCHGEKQPVTGHFRSDSSPRIDTCKEVEGLAIAYGFTGHGFGIGPITGLLLSELLLDGKTSTLPIDAFRYDRF